MVCAVPSEVVLSHFRYVVCVLICVIVAIYPPVQVTTLHKEAMERLQKERDWARVRPAFTCDLWCSATQREYLTVTAHWIDEVFSTGQLPRVRGCQWIMRRRVIATVQIDGDDEGKVSAEGEQAVWMLQFVNTMGMIIAQFQYNVVWLWQSYGPV